MQIDAVLAITRAGMRDMFRAWRSARAQRNAVPGIATTLAVVSVRMTKTPPKVSANRAKA